MVKLYLEKDELDKFNSADAGRRTVLQASDTSMDDRFDERFDSLCHTEDLNF